jgi:hypothetical protein
VHLTAIFEVRRAVLMSIQFLWDKMHIRLEYSYRSFGGVFLFSHLARMFLGFFDSKYGNILLLRKVEKLLAENTTSYSGGNESLSSPLRKGYLPLHIFIVPYLYFAPLIVMICVCR